MTSPKAQVVRRSPVAVCWDVVQYCGRGLWKMGWRFWLPAGWLMLVVLGALIVGYLPLADPNEMDLLSQGTPPDEAHWLGTDGMGRDVFTRVIYGARISLTVGLCAPLIAMILGTALGVSAGYFRGRWQSAVMMYADISLAFPGIILLLLLVTYLGQSLFNVTVALGILITPSYTRIARANTLSLVEREFITAARAMGAGHTRILLRQILPNVLLPVMAYTFVLVALVIVLEGVLSFLGLGVPAPAPSWGSMISEGRELLDQAPQLSMAPALVMFLTVLSFNILGDLLRKQFDTRESKM